LRLEVRRCSTGFQAGGRYVPLCHARPRLNLIVRPRLSLSSSPSLSPNLKRSPNLKPSTRLNLGPSLRGIRHRHGSMCLIGLSWVNGCTIHGGFVNRSGALQSNAGAIAVFEVPASISLQEHTLRPQTGDLGNGRGDGSRRFARQRLPLPACRSAGGHDRMVKGAKVDEAWSSVGAV
jgi:hypothetical protein